MHRIIICVLALSCLPAKLASGEDHYRIWNMTSGRKTKIKLAAVGLIGTRVVFKRQDDGRTFQFPIRNLARDQQTLIREMFLSPPPDDAHDNPFSTAPTLNPANSVESPWPAPVLTDQNLLRWADFIHPSNLELAGQQGPTDPDGIKFSVVARDLPRGNVLRPGANVKQRTAHGLSWIDLTADEVKPFVNESTTPRAVPQSALLKLAKRMKDNVRGECDDWHGAHVQSSQLIVERNASDATTASMRLTGEIEFAADDRSYRAQIHGRALWNKQTNQFDEFTIVASGQRSGGLGNSGRNADRGPAPMGVVIRMQKNTRQRNLNLADPNIINL